MITFLSFGYFDLSNYKDDDYIVVFSDKNDYNTSRPRLLYIKKETITKIQEGIEKDVTKFNDWVIKYNPFNTTFFIWLDEEVFAKQNDRGGTSSALKSISGESKFQISHYPKLNSGEKDIFPYSSILSVKDIYFKSDQVLVTVIITSYNRYDLLLQAIESVKNSKFSGELEIIVINDCSDDPRYIEFKDEKVRMINLPIRSKDIFGYACPGGWQRNFGMLLGSGKFFAFLDDDDLFEPDKLEIQISLMKEHNVFISSTNATILGTNDLYLKPSPGEPIWGDSDYKFLFKKDINKTNYFISSSVVIHRNLVEKVGYFRPLDFADDYEYWLRILGSGAGSLYINKPLIKYNKNTVKNYSENVVIHGSQWVNNYQNLLTHNSITDNFPLLVSLFSNPPVPNQNPLIDQAQDTNNDPVPPAVVMQNGSVFIPYSRLGHYMNTRRC